MALYARDRAASLRYTVRDEDGVPAAPGSAPNVVITDSDGTSVGSGTMTAASGTGNYTYSLPSSVLETLGAYDAAITYTRGGITSTVTVAVEVVADLLFDVAELRATYVEIDDDVRYTAQEIRDARDEATARLEEAAQVAFATRRTVKRIDGDDTTRLVLPDVEVTDVLYVEIDGTALDASELEQIDVRPEGVLVRKDGALWPYGSSNITVEYEHGYARPPLPIRRAAMRLALEALIPSAIPARALSQSSDLGEFRFSVANPEAGRPTGDPEIDAIILTFGRRRPGVG